MLDVVVVDVEEVVDVGSQGIGALLSRDTPPNRIC